MLHFVATFAIFLPPRVRNSVASRCEKGIKEDDNFAEDASQTVGTNSVFIKL